MVTEADEINSTIESKCIYILYVQWAVSNRFCRWTDHVQALKRWSVSDPCLVGTAMIAGHELCKTTCLLLHVWFFSREQNYQFSRSYTSHKLKMLSHTRDMCKCMVSISPTNQLPNRPTSNTVKLKIKGKRTKLERQSDVKLLLLQQRWTVKRYRRLISVHEEHFVQFYPAEPRDASTVWLSHSRATSFRRQTPRTLTISVTSSSMGTNDFYVASSRSACFNK